MKSRVLLFTLLALCVAAVCVAAPRQRRMQLLGAERPAPKYWPSLKWRLELGMVGGQCAPTAGDVNLDGKVDLFVPGVDGKLTCLLPEGRVLWSVNVGAPITAGVLLGDVDRDGAPEICVAAGKELVCLAADGKQKWRVQAEDKIAGMPVLADLDRDDTPEVYFGSNDKRLYCLEQGKVKWQFETKSWVVSSPAVADLVGDSRLEICFGSMDGNFYCLDAAGKECWRFDAGAWVQSSPAIGDIDSDRSLDICFAADNGALYSLTATGKLKWRVALEQEGKHQTGAIALADLDGNGTLETLFGSDNGRLHCVAALGEEVWGASCGGAITGSPIVADVNNDTYQEVLVGAADGRVHCFDTWGSQRWAPYLGSPVLGTPMLADLDADGKYEIYAGCVPTAENPKGSFSRYVITTRGGAIPWASSKGDPSRTGCAANAVDYGLCLRRGNDYATAWEPFHAAYRPEATLLPPRRVEVVAEVPLDDSRGNGNGVLDAGESALLRVAVHNRGTAPVYDLMLTLDPGESGLVPDRTRAFIGRVPGGSSKRVCFALKSPPDQSSTSAILTLQASEGNVNAGFARLRVAVSPALRPLLRAARWRILDSAGPLSRGNGNGRLDAGEQVLFWALIQNDGPVTAHNARMRLMTESPDLLLVSTVADLGTVVPGGGRQVRFSLRVAKKLAGKQAAVVLQSISYREPEAPAGGGVQRRERFPLPLGPSPLDLTPPVIAFSSPARATTSTFADTIVLQGRATDASGIARLTLNGRAVTEGATRPLKGGGVSFSMRRHLEVGENILTLTATDNAGNSTTSSLNVMRRPR